MPFKPGPLSNDEVSDLNKMQDAVESLRRTFFAPPFTTYRSAGDALVVMPPAPESFWALLTATTTGAWTWTEYILTAAGTWTIGPNAQYGVLNAYPVSGTTSAVGDYVRIWRSRTLPGVWEFMGLTSPWFDAQITAVSGTTPSPYRLYSWKRLSFGGGQYPDYSPATTGTNNAVPLPLPNLRVGVCTITIASPGVVAITETAGQNVVGPSSQLIFSTTGALPTGLTAGTLYYPVVQSNHYTFEVATTSGGAAINTSGSQSGVHTLYNTGYPVVTVGSKVLMRLMSGTVAGGDDLYEFIINQPAGDTTAVATDYYTPGHVIAGPQIIYGNKTFLNPVPEFVDTVHTEIVISDGTAIASGAVNQPVRLQFVPTGFSDGLLSNANWPKCRINAGESTYLGNPYYFEAGLWRSNNIPEGYHAWGGYWYTSSAFAIGNPTDGLTDLGLTATLDLAALAAAGTSLRFVGGIYVGQSGGAIDITTPGDGTYTPTTTSITAECWGSGANGGSGSGPTVGGGGGAYSTKVISGLTVGVPINYHVAAGNDGGSSWVVDASTAKATSGSLSAGGSGGSSIGDTTYSGGGGGAASIVAAGGGGGASAGPSGAGSSGTSGAGGGAGAVGGADAGSGGNGGASSALGSPGTASGGGGGGNGFSTTHAGGAGADGRIRITPI